MAENNDRGGGSGAASAGGSRAIQRIEERLSALEPGTLRHEALEAAKRFKSSWVELGRVLWSVWREKKFREWGYMTFEAYCAKEIGIRSATAKKLLHSYYFLEKEEPTALKRLAQGSPTSVPSAEAVNLLRLLKARKEFPQQNYEKFRAELLEKGREAPEVRRELRSILQPPEADPVSARAARREKTLQRMIGALKGMRMELASSNWVPKKIISEVEALTQKLEAALTEG